MKKIGVLISGGGTNLQALIDAVEAGTIDGEIAVVISNRSDAYGLERARTHGIPAVVAKGEEETLEALATHQVYWVVLAGYLKVLSPAFVRTYPNRIINIHPSLIPAFCGDGYYGMRVHEAVYEKGAKVSGATTHFVDEGTDTGPIIRQHAVALEDDDPPEIIQKKVLAVEHGLLVATVADAVKGRLEVKKHRVRRRKDDHETSIN